MYYLSSLVHQQICNESLQKIFVKIEIVRSVSDTKYPTTNEYFFNIYMIKIKINEWIESFDELIKMWEKYNKY